MVKGTNYLPDWDVTKAFTAFKVPGFDVEALIAAQKRNFEAVTEASKLAVAGAQKVASLQAEILRESLEETAEAAREVATAKPEDKAAAQAAYAKDAFEKGLANVKSINELMAKASYDAFGVIAKRISEGFDEFTTLVANGARVTVEPTKTSKK
ncbi:MAG TPA: phasin family protein [Alphaproteobacteria bacterium]